MIGYLNLLLKILLLKIMYRLMMLFLKDNTPRKIRVIFVPQSYANEEKSML